MFNDSDNGQTQYCEECLKKQKRIDELEKENHELKQQIGDLLMGITMNGIKNGFGGKRQC